jgi:Glycosyltransferase family 87
VRNSWLAAAIVFASLLALGLQASVVARTGFYMGDFRAFYCAARVASHGADPYRAQQLRACETSIAPKLFFQKNPGVTIPAPLPGYALAALVPLSALPFGVAAALWASVLLLAWIATIATLTRFAGVSWEIALAVFSLSLGVLSLPFGEVVPLALGCICLAGYFAWQNQWRAAALSALGAMIEPHLGLPVCVALAVWAPATRMPLALSIGALGAISLALLGPATNIEYVTSVLPAHALSEVARDTQYSLTAVLASLGAPPAAALRAGTLWYVAMLVLGTYLAGLLAKKSGNNAFLVCVPPAFVVFGGAFIHITQIAAALPAAVLLLSYANRERYTPALIALLALAVPWVWAISPALIVAPIVPVAYLAWCYWSENLRAALITGLVAGMLLFAFGKLAVPAPHAGANAIAPAIDARLAESTWSAFTERSSTNSAGAWTLRIPTWAGLVLLLTLLTRDAGVLRLRRERLMQYVPREVT